MDTDEKREFAQLLDALALGFGRMVKSFKQMKDGEDLQEGFRALGKMARMMERALQEYRDKLGVEVGPKKEDEGEEGSQ